eukprot:1195792-Prorocentrum_minimum.AAC.6
MLLLCSSCPSSDWSPPRVYPLVPPPIGPRFGYILLSFLRLVPASGISSCPSSDWSPPRVYPLVPPPIGPRLGYILLSLLRLVIDTESRWVGDGGNNLLFSGYHSGAHWECVENPTDDQLEDDGGEIPPTLSDFQGI